MAILIACGAALLVPLAFGVGWRWGRARLAWEDHLAEDARVLATYPTTRDGRSADRYPPGRYGETR